MQELRDKVIKMETTLFEALPRIEKKQEKIDLNIETILGKIHFNEGVDEEKERQETQKHKETKMQSGGIAAVLTIIGQLIGHYFK